MKGAGRIAAALLVAALLLPPPAFGGGRRDLVPADADLVVRVSDTAAFSERLAASGPGRLWRDEKVQEFLGRPEAARLFDDVERGAGEGGAGRGELLLEQFRLFQGEQVYAFRFPAGGGTFHVVAAADEEAYRRLRELDSRLDELSDRRAVTTVHRFHGRELIQHVTGSGEEEETEWYGFAAGTVAASDDRRWVEETLLRLGDGPASAPSGTPSLEVSVAAGRLIERAVAAAEAKASDNGDKGAQSARPGGGPKISPRAVFDALGITQLRAVDAAFHFDGEETRLTVSLRVDAPRRGLWKLFGSRPAGTRMRLSHVPRGAVSYGVGRYDLRGFWHHLPEMTAAISPITASQFAAFTVMLQNMYALDLDTDVLAALDTALVSFSTVGEGGEPSSVTAWRLRDAPTLAATLSRLLAEGGVVRQQLGATLAVEELRGHTLYVAKGPEETEKFAFGIVDRFLVVGAPGSVRGLALAAVGGEQESSFYRTPLFSLLAGGVPEEAIGYSVMNLSSWLEGLLSRLDEEAFESLRARLLEKEEEDERGPDYFERLAAGLSWSRMPPPAHLASFFGTVYSYSLDGPDGLETTFVFTD